MIITSLLKKKQKKKQQKDFWWEQCHLCTFKMLMSVLYSVVICFPIQLIRMYSQQYDRENCPSTLLCLHLNMITSSKMAKHNMNSMLDMKIRQIHWPHAVLVHILTLKVLNFWKLTSYCSLKPLWSGMGEVVPARTSPTLHLPFPPTVHHLSWLPL